MRHDGSMEHRRPPDARRMKLRAVRPQRAARARRRPAFAPRTGVGQRWRSRGGSLIVQCAVTAGLAWFVAQRGAGSPGAVLRPGRGDHHASGSPSGSGCGAGSRSRSASRSASWSATCSCSCSAPGPWQIMRRAARSPCRWPPCSAPAADDHPGRRAVDHRDHRWSATRPGASSRWLDAVIGCALALLVATIAPSAPLRKPGASGRRRSCTSWPPPWTPPSRPCASATRRPPTRCWPRPGPARRRWPTWTRRPAKGWPWSGTRRSGGASCRPCRRTPTCQTPLDHASRNLRVLARRCAVALWRGEQVPPATGPDGRAGRA